MPRPWLLFLPLCLSCDLVSRGDEQRAGQTHGWATASRRDPGTLVVGRPADALSLDPARVGDLESAEVCEQIYETLVVYDPATRTVRPGLAESWKMSADGRVWTFRLRRGVTFHDRTPLDADAVVFSLERQRDPDHRFHGPDRSGFAFSLWENMFRNIRKVEKQDSHTVRITIDRLYAPFEASMATFPVAIVSPSAVERWGGDYYLHPVGTGPFKFASWEAGRIVLERNDDYWGPKPAMERLVFREIPDARQRLIELESAAIDLAYSILPDELQFVELLPDLDVYREAANAVAYLAMNNMHPPFDDVRVRRAVNHAINKDPIVKLAYQGLASVANGPLPPEQWGYHPARTSYRYDPERARELLREAAADGHFDPARTHRLYATSTPRSYLPEPEMVARVLQANLESVGIKTELVIHGFSKHIEAVERGEHDLGLFGWAADSSDPDNFLYILFDRDNTTPGLAQNLAFYRDAELHQLLLDAQRTTDRARREELYRRAQERIALEAPWVPLAHSEMAVAARLDVKGIVIHPTTGVEFKGMRRIVR